MNQFKSFFFDRVDWEKVLQPAEYKVLWKIGMDLMEQGRRNIRRRKKPGRAGSTPTSWGPEHKLKKSIYYGLDLDNLTVFAGPIKFAGQKSSKPLSQPTIPAVLEFGGKIWHRWPATVDPPRVREYQEPRRVVNLKPRPYMEKAAKQKRKAILKKCENMLGKSPASIMIAQNRGQRATGKKAL